MKRMPLLLCPGLLNDQRLWAHQLDGLADLAEMQVADLTGQESIAALANNLLSKAPDRFALAGLSMGGYVAFEILRRAPERVDRLALFNTSARPDTPEATQRRLELLDITKRGGFGKIPRPLLATQLHPDHLDLPHIGLVALAMAETVGALGFIHQQTAIMTRPDSRPGLSAVAVPTLVVGGQQDGLTTPAIMQEIADGIPGARLVLVDHCGHLSPLEQPSVVTALLREWLQS